MTHTVWADPSQKPTITGPAMVKALQMLSDAYRKSFGRKRPEHGLLYPVHVMTTGGIRAHVWCFGKIGTMVRGDG